MDTEKFFMTKTPFEYHQIENIDIDIDIYVPLNCHFVRDGKMIILILFVQITFMLYAWQICQSTLPVYWRVERNGMLQCTFTTIFEYSQSYYVRIWKSYFIHAGKLYEAHSDACMRHSVSTIIIIKCMICCKRFNVVCFCAYMKTQIWMNWENRYTHCVNL